MSQFFNDHKIHIPGKFERKKLRIFKKMLFSWEGLLNADKRQQIAKTIIYKALKRFADLQGPICYNDPQNKGISLIVY